MAAVTDSTQVASSESVRKGLRALGTRLQRGQGLPRVWINNYTVDTGNVDDANDILELVTFPPGTYLLDGDITITDVDSGGVPAHVFDILLLNSVGATVETLVSGSTVGQGGGSAAFSAGGRYVYAGDLTLVMKTTTGAATAQAGTLRVGISVSMGVISHEKWPFTLQSV